jgi:hypothetical protein
VRATRVDPRHLNILLLFYHPDAGLDFCVTASGELTSSALLREYLPKFSIKQMVRTLRNGQTNVSPV